MSNFEIYNIRNNFYICRLWLPEKCWLHKYHFTLKTLSNTLKCVVQEWVSLMEKIIVYKTYPIEGFKIWRFCRSRISGVNETSDQYDDGEKENWKFHRELVKRCYSFSWSNTLNVPATVEFAVFIMKFMVAIAWCYNCVLRLIFLSDRVDFLWSRTR